MRFVVGLLLLVTAVCANPVLRWQEEQQIPVEVVEIPEPIVYVAPVQSLSTIESVQEVEEPEPIAISNEIVVPLVEVVPEKEPSLKTIQKEKENEDKPKLEEKEEEQRKDDQLQVETVQREKYVNIILPAPHNFKPVPDVPQEVEGEISSEVKQLTPAEVDTNVAPEAESETEDNGLRQDPVPQGLPSTTRQPPPSPPNLLQQFITNPLQSIQNALTGQQSTPVADDGPTTPSLLQQGLTSVQNTVQGLQQNLQHQFQTVQHQLSSLLPTTAPLAAQADTPVGDATTVRPPFNPIQSIQSALSNLLPQAQPQQEGQQPVSQGPLSGILNLFSPTRAPTTYPPQPTSVAPQFDAVTEIKDPLKDGVSFDSVESTEQSGEISVVREADAKKDKIENKDKVEKKKEDEDKKQENEEKKKAE